MHNELNKWQRRVLYFLIGWLMASIVVLVIGCSKQVVPMKHECRSDPIMKEVVVVNGSVSGKSLDNVVDNVVSLWDQIEYLKIRGCK